jgi:hypothetical protein
MVRKMVVLVMFKRTQYTPVEHGIGVGIGTGDIDIDVIVDVHGKVVETPIWHFKTLPLGGLMWFNIPEPE